MVMHNRGDGSGTPHWWDDLPPKVRDRFTQPLTHEEEPTSRAPEPPAPPSRRELVRDLSRLAILFCLIALGNVLFLLVALSYIAR
jgi:hypothetical protein